MRILDSSSSSSRLNISATTATTSTMVSQSASTTVSSFTPRCIVTLDPPVATVEFSEGEKPLKELQEVVTENAGDYTLKE